MSQPNTDTVNNPTGQSTNPDCSGPNAGTNLDAILEGANSASQGFIDGVKGIEVNLQAEVTRLSVFLAAREAVINVLNAQIASLRDELSKKENCDDKDELSFLTDDELAKSPPKPKDTGRHHATWD